LEEQMSFYYIGEDVMLEDVEYGDDVVVLVAGGELDFAASPQLRERIAGHVNAGRKHLVLDLSTATFIDSTAIGVLVGAVARMRENGGGSLVVVCPEDNERVLGIFEIAGVESLFALHPSREEALAALGWVG
jgi:anti-sigma B factor antagonist